MNSLERLIYMANQIARNFATLAPSAAIAEVADHLAKFWDPRMKAMILAHRAAGGEGLTPTALAAIGQLTRAANESPADGLDTARPGT